MQIRDWVLIAGPLVGVLIGGGITSVAKYFELKHQSKLTLLSWRIERLEQLSEKLGTYMYELDMLPTRVIELVEPSGNRVDENVRFHALKAETSNHLMTVLTRLAKYLPGQDEKVKANVAGKKLFMSAQNVFKVLQTEGATEADIEIPMKDFIEIYSEHQDVLINVEISITNEIQRLLEERTPKKWMGIPDRFRRLKK